MNVYIEQVLIVLGGLSVVLAVAFSIYLIVSKHKSNMYKKIIDDDTTEILSLMQVTENFWRDDSKSIDLEKTQLLTEPVSYTEFISNANNPTEILNDNIFDSRFKFIEEGVLENKYVIEKELGGGGMSQVYLARHKKLGNKWVIKYIDNSISSLTNEEDILKRLNHINLPKIIDIFHDKNGMYIVETYIEGVSLDKVLASGQTISPALALDFAEQFTMVLSYLHNLKPQPIIHCDLKPSNIIITPDNKLVLIDFGISKISGSNEDAPMAATYRYAAPEQLKKKVPSKYMGLVSLRFGEDAVDFFQNATDERTDIFSMGAILFEMITGQIPTVNNKGLVKNFVSEDFTKIIYRCIQTNPDKRFDNVEQIRKALQNVRISKVSMLRNLFVRRVVFLTTMFLFLFSFLTLAGGTYLIQLENGATVVVYPDSVTVSMKQSSEIVLEKIFENGKVNDISPERVAWVVKDNDVATVTGTKIIGLAAGSTEVIGTYKDKKIKIRINVTENMENQAEVSLKYSGDGTVSKWCGEAGAFESVDGDLNTASFCLTSGIAQTENGDIYVSDSGIIRKFDGKRFSTLEMEQTYITIDVIRASGNNLYALSGVWYDLNGAPKYGLYKVENNKYVPVAEFDAENTNINDFAVDGDYIYYAVSIPYADSSTLTRLNLKTGETENLYGIESDVKGICADSNVVYMSTYDEYANNAGIIAYDTASGEVENIAGVENMRNFIDDYTIQCFAPKNLQFYNGELYFNDYNVIRKIVFEEEGVESVTVAGVPSATFSDETITEPVPCDEVVLSNLNNNFVVTKNGILVTDTYNGYILKIQE